jgi:uncharacterized protein (DUF1778 family)
MKKQKTSAEPKKRPSGGAHLKAAGKTGILIGLTAEQLDILDRACKLEGRSRANFVAHYSVVAAAELLARISNGK